MRRPDPLPEPLRLGAFDRAGAAASGVADGRLRGPAVVRPFRGVYRAEEPRSLEERCRAALLRMGPDDLFSHTTALALWGAPVPAAESDVHILRARGLSRVTGRGIVGHRTRDRPPHVVLQGIPVVEPALAWLQSASRLGSESLIAAGDALVSETVTPFGRLAARLDPSDLSRALAAAHGMRGVARARRALEAVRIGVHSAAETRLRLTLVRLGFPEPVTQYPVLVAPGVVLHPDLAWPELRIGLEYEGEVHRLDRATWRADITRRERFEAVDWRIIRVHDEHLRVPLEIAEFARRVRAVRRARLAEIRPT